MESKKEANRTEEVNEQHSLWRSCVTNPGAVCRVGGSCPNQYRALLLFWCHYNLCSLASESQARHLVRVYTVGEVKSHLSGFGHCARACARACVSVHACVHRWGCLRGLKRARACGGSQDSFFFLKGFQLKAWRCKVDLGIGHGILRNDAWTRVFVWKSGSRRAGTGLPVAELTHTHTHPFLQHEKLARCKLKTRLPQQRRVKMVSRQV